MKLVTITQWNSCDGGHRPALLLLALQRLTHLSIVVNKTDRSFWVLAQPMSNGLLWWSSLSFWVYGLIQWETALLTTISQIGWGHTQNDHCNLWIVTDAVIQSYAVHDQWGAALIQWSVRPVQVPVQLTGPAANLHAAGVRHVVNFMHCSTNPMQTHYSLNL